MNTRLVQWAHSPPTKLWSASSEFLVISDATLATKCQAPALHTPAAHVENARDDGVLVHRVLDVDTHVEMLLFWLGWLMEACICKVMSVSFLGTAEAQKSHDFIIFEE